MRGTGRVVFAATLLLIAGTLNIIYGIGALDSANIFANDTRYIFTNLNTMGWVLIILGVIVTLGDERRRRSGPYFALSVEAGDGDRTRTKSLEGP